LAGDGPAFHNRRGGRDFPNKNGGVPRRFEITLCRPGEPVHLLPEPKNPADPHAVMILSARGIQIGYLTAERAPWIGGMISNGRPIEAVFQSSANFGAYVRIAFDGEAPVLPE
jgi:hypothetical protein